MKFQPIYYRESSVAFFGKRGIAWHGTMLHADVDKKGMVYMIDKMVILIEQH